jgi:ATP-dependent helicase YprA (DUF1998 family)
MGSLWQQAGRGGRGTRASVALFIALDSPLDQALVANPASLLRREVEAAILDPHNPHILRGHLAAAAHELPLVRQAFPSWMRSILTEIYLRRTCSCQEILRMETPGQAAAALGAMPPPRPLPVRVREGDNDDRAARRRHEVMMMVIMVMTVMTTMVMTCRPMSAK